MILLVDDNRLLWLAVEDRFDLEGWHIDACADGLEALAKIESGATYDVLVLDNDLPGAGGLELTRRARDLKHRRGVPIIIISASEIEEEARQAGANCFLKKPFDLNSIIRAIEGLLASSVAE